MHTSAMLSQSFHGRYRLVKRLGAGGMGEVFEAVQSSLNRRVALKFLKAEAFRDAESRKRFVFEAQILARLSHPNVVTVFDADVDDQQPYIAMEFIDGPTLSQHVRGQGKLALQEAVTLGRSLLDGLAYLHQLGVLHRDLKPENVLLAGGSVPKLADFGLARSIGESHLTAEGFLVGTPMYLAPEQIEGVEATPAVDVYAFGMLFFFMLTGSYPLAPAPLLQLALAKRELSRKALAPRLSGVPGTIVTLVARCLAPLAQERFPTAGALQQALVEAVTRTPVPRPQPSPPPARPRGARLPGIALAVTAALAVVVAAGLAWTKANRVDPQPAAVSRPAPKPVKLAAEAVRTPAGFDFALELPSPLAVTLQVRVAGQRPRTIDLPASAAHRLCVDVPDPNVACEVEVRPSAEAERPGQSQILRLAGAAQLSEQALKAAARVRETRFIERLFIDRAKNADPAVLQRRVEAADSRERMQEKLAAARAVLTAAVAPDGKPDAARSRLVRFLEELSMLDQSCLILGLGYRSGIDRVLERHWRCYAGDPPPGGKVLESNLAAPVYVAGKTITAFATYAFAGPDKDWIDFLFDVPSLAGVTRACVSARVQEARPDEMVRACFGYPPTHVLELLLRYDRKEPATRDVYLNHHFDPVYLHPGKNNVRLEFDSPKGALAIHVRIAGARLTLF